MANLILWRHAEAEEISTNGTDSGRALTKHGRKDADKMAKWLNQHLPSDVQILCSPALRCLETAKALKKLNQQKFRIVDFLGVDGTLETMAREVLREDSTKTLLLIGHQPNLGLFIAQLQGMSEAICVVKKGAVWWLRQRTVDGALQTYLFTVQHPDYL